jgi:precorrin-2 dehydrogenase / sirohydrochlorin ferrochelatase
MSYYPVNLNLQDREVLVVGGGNVAQGKTEQLLKARACVTLVSPELTPRVREMA